MCGWGVCAWWTSHSGSPDGQNSLSWKQYFDKLKLSPFTCFSLYSFHNKMIMTDYFNHTLYIYSSPHRSTNKILTADCGSSPFHTGASLITGCCICCYSRAETLTVSSCIAATRVSHTDIMIDFWIHLFERKIQEEAS